MWKHVAALDCTLPGAAWQEAEEGLTGADPPQQSYLTMANMIQTCVWVTHEADVLPHFCHLQCISGGGSVDVRAIIEA